MADTTVLTLEGMGVVPYSARGLTQSLKHIPQSSVLQRTVNGTLISVSPEQMRKYSSVISGSDQQPPALESVWPGTQLTVGCIAELSIEEDTTEFERPYVAGSIRQESGFTFYRPLLVMLVVSFSVNRDEWGASNNWTLTLEEV